MHSIPGLCIYGPHPIVPIVKSHDLEKCLWMNGMLQILRENLEKQLYVAPNALAAKRRRTEEKELYDLEFLHRVQGTAWEEKPSRIEL